MIFTKIKYIVYSKSATEVICSLQALHSDNHIETKDLWYNKHDLKSQWVRDNAVGYIFMRHDHEVKLGSNEKLIRS